MHNINTLVNLSLAWSCMKLLLSCFDLPYCNGISTFPCQLILLIFQNSCHLINIQQNFRFWKQYRKAGAHCKDLVTVKLRVSISRLFQKSLHALPKISFVCVHKYLSVNIRNKSSSLSAFPVFTKLSVIHSSKFKSIQQTLHRCPAELLNGMSFVSLFPACLLCPCVSFAFVHFVYKQFVILSFLSALRA